MGDRRGIERSSWNLSTSQSSLAFHVIPWLPDSVLAVGLGRAACTRKQTRITILVLVVNNLLPTP
jgi:hypothetical protein